MKDNFKKYRRSFVDSLGIPYDYESLMHYKVFSIQSIQQEPETWTSNHNNERQEGMLLRLIIQFILFLFPDILIISIVTVSIFPSCANSWQTKISLLGPSSHWEPRQTESWTPIAQAIIGVTNMLHSLPQTLLDRPLS